MKFRVRLGKERFVVQVNQENAKVENLKEAICHERCIRDVSSIQVSLNGKDVIEENDRSLNSLGLVNGDLVYALSSNPEQGTSSDKNALMLSQLVDMGFDKELAEHALLQVSYSSIEAVIETITNNEVGKGQSLHDDKSVDDTHNQPSTSGTSDIPDETRHVVDNICNPVFCRDGVSATLETLYNNADIKTHHHAVFVLVHALMLESGFCLKDSESHELQETLPVKWNTSNIIKLSYVHNLSPSISSQLVLCSLGPFICANVWSEETKSDAYKVKLVVSQYIRGDVTLTAGAKSAYKNLHKVSRIVKNDLVHPLLANIQSYLGITSPLSLNGLPPEVQLMILSHLSAASLVSLSSTCKALNVVCNDDKLWRFFCQRDFGVETNTEDSWKKQYKQLYKRWQRVEREKSEARSFIPEFPLGSPGFNPFLPRIPQIIGGPHDLFPDFLTGQPRGESSLQIFYPDNRSRSDLRLRTNERATRGTFFA